MIQFANNKHHSRAVVIGGGLLGLEAAHGLQAYGLDVAVVHSGGHLMNAQMGPDGGAILRRSVEALGIEVHTGSRTTAILGKERISGVSLRDQRELDCDMVVVTAGIRPNVDVAVVSGLAVERGIVVDDRLRVMDEEDIYAVGGVRSASRRGVRTGGATVGAGRRAGRSGHGGGSFIGVLGSRTATKLKVAGVDVASMGGLAGPERETDEHIVFSEPSRGGVFKSIVIRDNKMVGATLLGGIAGRWPT